MATEESQLAKDQATKPKFYLKKHQSWTEVIPGYITPRIASTLSGKEKERLLRGFIEPTLPVSIHVYSEHSLSILKET